MDPIRPEANVRAMGRSIGFLSTTNSEQDERDTMAEMKDRLRADMTAAMKAKEKEKTKVLRAALSSIGNAEVAGDQATELSADAEQAIVAREVRQRKDSAASYSEAGRDDLARTELSEIEILQAYLPTPLTDDELNTLVDEEVSAAGPDVSMKQMGQIIKAVNAKAEGRADGGRVAAAVKAKLA